MQARLFVVVIVALVHCVLTIPARVAAADAKTVVKCQATLKKAGAKFTATKIAALAKCDIGIFKCIQAVDETSDAGAKRTSCVTKARSACLKGFAKLSVARRAFGAAITGACGTLDSAQLVADDGLGFGGVDCSKFGVTVTDVASLRECLVMQHDCQAGKTFQREVPRALELLQFTPPESAVVPAADVPALACLEDLGGTGADVDDLDLGKRVVKCQAAIQKTSTKLGAGRFKILAKCTDALFACVATKTGTDVAACREKAGPSCAKAFAKGAAQVAAAATTLRTACGDPAVSTAMRLAAGANFDGLLPSTLKRAGAVDLCASAASFDELIDCLLEELIALIDELIRLLSPQSDELLDSVGCTFDECGLPVPTPTPTRTPTRTPTPTKTHGPTPAGTPQVTQIIGASGDGAHAVDGVFGIAVDAISGNVFVTSQRTNRVFKITPAGTVTSVLDSTGDGMGHTMSIPWDVVVDPNGNAFVASGGTDTVFKITSAGTITAVITGSGDGAGHALDFPEELAVDAGGNVYVTGVSSNNAFKITPGGGITQILGPAGDGLGHGVDSPHGIAADAAGNAFVASTFNDRIFKIAAGGTVTQILDHDGDHAGHPLNDPSNVATDGSSVFVSSNGRVWKIASNGVATVLVDGVVGDGFGHQLDPRGIAVDASGNVYVVSNVFSNAFKITPAGDILQIIDQTGDGLGHVLNQGWDVTAAPDGSLVFVSSATGKNAFKIVPQQ